MPQQLHQMICFVCGSAGATYSIHVQQRDKGAYFPFLKNHEPPKCARPLSRDGIVDSCSVCYLFLNQQWDSYEQNRTPAVKRLYWLKRIDDGAFTGAEMRLQGEYAAQVMGLQYQPSGSGTLSPYDYNYPPGPSSQGIACGSHKPIHDDSALDLSTPTKPRRKASSEVKAPRDPSPKLMDGTTIVCYICAKEHPSTLGRFIYAMKHADDEPFFPFMMDLPFPQGAMPLTKNGLTKACSHCRKTLSRQWRFFESNRVSEEQRIYQINDKPIITKKMQPQQQSLPLPPLETRGSPERAEGCFLCGELAQRPHMKLLSTRSPSPSSNHIMYFPFLTSHKKPPNARDMDSHGRVLACRACYSYLQRQWQMQLSDSVPVEARRFQLRPLHAEEPLNIKISAPSVSAPSSSSGLLAIASTTTSKFYDCSLCGAECSVASQYLLRVTANPEQPQEPYFPNLKAVEGRDAIQSCYFCYHSFIAQWTEFQAMRTPHVQRKYRTSSFICYTCSREVQRSKVRCVTLEEFPFLKEHPRPAGSVRIQVDEAVLVCTSCQQTLRFHQKLAQKTRDQKQDPDDPAFNAARSPEHGSNRPGSTDPRKTQASPSPGIAAIDRSHLAISPFSRSLAVFPDYYASCSTRVDQAPVPGIPGSPFTLSPCKRQRLISPFPIPAFLASVADISRHLVRRSSPGVATLPMALYNSDWRLTKRGISSAKRRANIYDSHSAYCVYDG
ncbi:hypothetical protein CAPTEDRAFT_211171 [Capitella teleta]|uniref:Genetic suppressor element-like domain-containing protein n=1 Tax=Capitella teleta TaxID=283909 RepID=R7UHE4_CAPTE|nr:hypothetical protein CAPTEDRAFT_211171 [Capitella teleta]|eukprot:ELU03233.1 hypothetical protein CAPTEDRAFT_211171 [Capitella teleta]